MKIRHTLLALAIAATPYSVSYAQSLNTVIAEAVLSNPQVQSVMNARNAVFEEVKQASAGYLPTIDIGAGVGYEKTKNFPGDDTELKRS